MKKPISLFALMIMIALTASCGAKTGSSELIDGVYSVTFDEADSTDWKAFLIGSV